MQNIVVTQNGKKVEPKVEPKPVVEEPKLEEVYEGYSVLGKIKIDKIKKCYEMK